MRRVHLAPFEGGLSRIRLIVEEVIKRRISRLGFSAVGIDLEDLERDLRDRFGDDLYAGIDDRMPKRRVRRYHHAGRSRHASAHHLEQPGLRIGDISSLAS